MGRRDNFVPIRRRRASSAPPTQRDRDAAVEEPLADEAAPSSGMARFPMGSAGLQYLAKLLWVPDYTQLFLMEFEQNLQAVGGGGFDSQPGNVRRLAACFRALVVAACARGAARIDLHHGLAEVARRRVARGHRGRGCRLRHIARNKSVAPRLRLVALRSTATCRKPFQIGIFDVVSFMVWVKIGIGIRSRHSPFM